MGKKSKSKMVKKDNANIQVSDNKSFPNGAKINDVYRFESDGVNYYVYEGLCNDRLTKWITKSEWDYKITICFDGVGHYPADSKGDFITVLEKDDPNDIESWNIISR